ncbi:MAG: hypothetical protein JST86_14070 [Bacteroidetes bacterium]|nr:hypothetical protein [Bacteroidota bacterium]
MKPISIILLTIVVFRFVSHSQIKGTLLIAGIGKDGLIMVADSRGSIFNSLKISKYDFISIVTSFVKYTDSLYPVSKFPSSKTTSFIFVGSDSANYFIQGYMRDLGYTRIVRKKVLISDANAVPSLGIYYEYSSLYTCDTLANEFIKAIYSYAKKANLEFEIGGPISILCIGLNNKLKYFKNSFSRNTYLSFSSFIKDLKNGKRKFIPIVSGGDKKAIQAIIETHK